MKDMNPGIFHVEGKLALRDKEPDFVNIQNMLSSSTSPGPSRPEKYAGDEVLLCEELEEEGRQRLRLKVVNVGKCEVRALPPPSRISCGGGKAPALAACFLREDVVALSGGENGLIEIMRIGEGSWRLVGRLPSDATEHALCATPAGVYMIGGRDRFKGASSECYALRASLQLGSTEPAGATGVNRQRSASEQEFAWSVAKWTRIPPLKQKRHSFGSLTLVRSHLGFGGSESIIVVVGGSNDGHACRDTDICHALDSIEIYEESKGCWRVAVQKMFNARRTPHCTYENGSLIIMGGFDSIGRPVPTMECFPLGCLMGNEDCNIDGLSVKKSCPSIGRSTIVAADVISSCSPVRCSSFQMTKFCSPGVDEDLQAVGSRGKRSRFFMPASMPIDDAQAALQLAASFIASPSVGNGTSPGFADDPGRILPTSAQSEIERDGQTEMKMNKEASGEEAMEKEDEDKEAEVEKEKQLSISRCLTSCDPDTALSSTASTAASNPTDSAVIVPGVSATTNAEVGDKKAKQKSGGDWRRALQILPKAFKALGSGGRRPRSAQGPFRSPDWACANDERSFPSGEKAKADPLLWLQIDGKEED